jgi:Glucose-6-phosphate dehydrogenase, NAD binding domain
MGDLRQGCATGKGAENAAPADALVLFGAMGDLAHKKIFPALIIWSCMVAWMCL